MDKNTDFILKSYKYVQDNIKDIVVHLIISFYHNYKEEEDSLEQVFNSVLETFFLTKNIQNKLLEEVKKELETKYYYKITNENPLKIKNIL